MRVWGIMSGRAGARDARSGEPVLGSVVVFALSLKRSGDCLPAKPILGGRRLQSGTEFVALTLCCAPRVIAALLRRLAGAETALFH
jgi:hypothetical protein